MDIKDVEQCKSIYEGLKKNAIILIPVLEIDKEENQITHIMVFIVSAQHGINILPQVIPLLNIPRIISLKTWNIKLLIITNYGTKIISTRILDSFHDDIYFIHILQIAAQRYNKSCRNVVVPKLKICKFVPPIRI